MNPRKKIIIFSIIFGLISLALVCFVIYPLFKEIKKNSSEFVALKKELAMSKNETEKFGEVKEIYKNLEPDLKKIDKLFTNSEVPIELIQFWEAIAKDSGLFVDILPAPLKTVEGETWGSIGFQITLAGSSSNFLKFLEKTETGPYLIEIQNLIVKKTAGEELRPKGYTGFSPEDVSATLVTKVYTK